MNAELIERLREMGGRLRHEAADTLESADKRIAELEQDCNDMGADYQSCGQELYETGCKLDEAHKRIAELEAAIIGWKADQKENMATAVEECKRANEAERKLAVAREAIQQTIAENGHLADGDVCTLKSLKEALAQIGGGE